MRILQATTGPRPLADGRILVKAQRSLGIYIMLALLLGIFGVHNFYAGRIGSAVLQLLLTMSSVVLIFPMLFVCFLAVIECIVVTHNGQGDPLG